MAKLTPEELKKKDEDDRRARRAEANTPSTVTPPVVTPPAGTPPAGTPPAGTGWTTAGNPPAGARTALGGGTVNGATALGGSNKFPNNLDPNNITKGGGSIVSGIGSGNRQVPNIFQQPTDKSPEPPEPPEPPAPSVMDSQQLRGRKGLAAEIKSYVNRGQKISTEDATRMNEVGAGLGLKPSDLGKLYGKYKSDQFGSLMGPRSSSSLAGSVGKLNERRTLGTLSGAMRTEARRLRKQGYGKAAEQMALGASTARLDEPRILTQEQRGRMDYQAKQAENAGREAAAAQAEMTQYMRDLYKRRQADLDAGGSAPNVDPTRMEKQKILL